MKKFKYMLLSGLLSAVTMIKAQTNERTEIVNLPKKQTDSLVIQVCRSIKNAYFDIEKGKRLQQLLMNNLESGKFYNLPTDTVTKKITKLLRSETNDIHFFIGTQAYLQQRDMSGGVPENYNGGFVDVKILPHNIGYIKYVRCIADSAAYEKMANAMNFLKGCTSVLFDITENPGGDGSSPGFINEYLFKGDAHRHLLVKTCRNSGDHEEAAVKYRQPVTNYFQNIPVYIMTSKHTGSAAEYFAFVAQQLKRATILGQKTAGAANPVVGITSGLYYFQIPTCQIYTTDGKTFEGTGIIPDVQLSSNDWIKEATDYIIAKIPATVGLASGK